MTIMTRIPLCVITLLLGGCMASSENDEPSSATTEAASSSATTSVKGTYSVPVSDPALAEAANYPVQVKLRTRRGSERLHYTLPKELVGVPQEVDLVGPSGGALRGPAGVAECSTNADGRVCNEKLTGIHVDLVAVEAALAANPDLSEAEREAKLDVAKQFSIDPVGVLRFSLRER